MKTLKGYILLITGFLACPCHLPLTLPLLLAVTAGTAIGALLASNIWLIVAVSTIYFVSALALGWRYVTQDEKACEVSQPKLKARMKSQTPQSEAIQEVQNG